MGAWIYGSLTGHHVCRGALDCVIRLSVSNRGFLLQFDSHTGEAVYVDDAGWHESSLTIDVLLVSVGSPIS